MSSIIPNATLLFLQNMTGYVFQTPDLAWLAMQAAGSNAVRIGGVMVGRSGNKRLALVGDAALALVIKTRWFEDVALLDLVEADHRFKDIASNTNLNIVGQSLNLGFYINGNPSAGGMIAPKVMADTVEALLGAIFLDSGKDLAAVEAAMMLMGIH